MSRRGSTSAVATNTAMPAPELAGVRRKQWVTPPELKELIRRYDPKLEQCPEGARKLIQLIANSSALPFSKYRDPLQRNGVYTADANTYARNVLVNKETKVFLFPSIVRLTEPVGTEEDPLLMMFWQETERPRSLRMSEVRDQLRALANDHRLPRDIQLKLQRLRWGDGTRLDQKTIAREDMLTAPNEVGPTPIENTASGDNLSEVRSFRSWLIQNKHRLPPRTFAHPPAICWDVGDCVITAAASWVAGYQQIHIQRAAFPMDRFTALIHPFESKWAKQLEMEKDKLGMKASVVRMTDSASDDPALTLEVDYLPYHMVHSFHQLTLNEEVRASFTSEAFRYKLPEGRAIPANLSIDVAIVLDDPVIVGSESNPKSLVLAHRIYRDRGYTPRTWSASFEESFNPLAQQHGGRVVPPDRTPFRTAVRGLKQEFLGKLCPPKVCVSIQAAFVSVRHWTLGLIAIVHLPGVTFQRLQDMWATGEPEDAAAEHDGLAAIPLRRECLENGLRSSCPADIIVSHSPGVEEFFTDPWHQSSHARLACCLWMKECGLL